MLHVIPPAVEPSPYGLLSVVEARWDEPDQHWRAGVRWESLCGAAATTYDACLAVTGTGGPPPLPPGKAAGVEREHHGATPFTVYAMFNCSPATWAADALERAQTALKRLESYQVEQAFWTGLAGGQRVAWPHLAADAELRDGEGILLQTAAEPITGAVLPLVEGLGRLEQALGNCSNGGGIIHVPASLGPALAAAQQLRIDGSRLVTVNGNTVVLGDGYPGTGPDGSTPAAGTAWIYATGPVMAYRSDVWIPEHPSTIDRANNTASGLAERTYVLGFDCCLFAVQVSADPDGALVLSVEGETGHVLVEELDHKLVINATDGDAGYPIGQAGAVETGLSVLSSFAGGEDEGQPGQFDSTGRINLYSYQRADVESYGENIRHFLMRGNAKSMDAWYFPDGGYNGSLEPVGTFKPVVWTGAHWQANDGLSNHKHWSVETPDSTGAIQTRFEIRFGDTAVNNAIAGLDKTLIMTNLADFVVRCANGQELRLSASAGTEKSLMFSNDSLGANAHRRWRLRATSETESGGNAGTNFQLARYDDTGTFVDNPIVVSRSTGNVTLGPGFIARRASATVSSVSVNSTSLGGGVGVLAIGNADTVPAGTPTGGGVLYVEAGALKFKGSGGTVTTIANA